MIEAKLASKQQLPHAVIGARTSAAYEPGDLVRVSRRFPVGHRAPHYIRGKRGRVEAVLAPAAAADAHDRFAENTAARPRRYRIVIPLGELWPEYAGTALSGLHAEIPDAWLEAT